jgi:hypothetical protein
MNRRPETPGPRWTIEAYETDGGDAPAWSFIRQIEGRDIPPTTLARMRVLQTEVASRGAARRLRGAKR